MSYQHSALICWLIIYNYCIILTVSEPVSLSIAGAALAMSASFAGYNYLKCKLKECCTEAWINLNVWKLKSDLETRLYGQHLVIDTVVKALKSHFSNQNPSKALVLSFHGLTGSGKNYVAEIIAQNLYVKGTSSQYFKLFMPGVHFRDGESWTSALKLQQQIMTTVTMCDRSLFLFDEVDKVPANIIGAVKSFIDYHKKVDSIDYSRSIFIFISNTGSSVINQMTLEHYSTGKHRETIKLADVEKAVIKAAFNEDGGLKFNELIEHHLIDHFIPFLPLERSHIKLCIKDYILHTRGGIFKGFASNETFVSQISDLITYFPKDMQLFSGSGCKRLAHKIDVELENFLDDQFEKMVAHYHVK